jgi:hypothetical protein
VDFKKPWTIDMLPDDAKINIDRLKLKENKGYIGDPHSDFILETGFCPYCCTPMVIAEGCSHVVFFYDLVSSEYIYVNDSFKDLLKSLHKSNDELPLPHELAQLTKSIKLCSVKGKYAFQGAIWGFRH